MRRNRLNREQYKDDLFLDSEQYWFYNIECPYFCVRRHFFFGGKNCGCIFLQNILFLFFLVLWG